MADQQVAFRRVHGRVIPIKSKPTVGKSAAMVAGGVAVAAAGGAVAARGVREAAHFERTARSFAKQAANSKFAESAARNATQAHAYADAAFARQRGLKIAAVSAGGALVGEGLNKLHESIRGRDSTVGEATTARALGISAALAADTAYFRSLSGGGVTKGMKEAFKRILRKTI